MALQAPGFEEWIAEGTQTHFGQLVPAVANAPSNTLAADITRRIAALDKLALQHRTLLNTCTSPLLRLPREIWMRILSCAAHKQHVREWVKLGHACSAIRDALLENRILWGDAVCSWFGRRHRDELLERAGPSVPLRLIVRDKSDAHFAVNHLARARSIHTAQIEFLRQFVHNQDRLPLPYLEEVRLDYNYPSLDPLVSSQTLSRFTPQLKRATLVDVFWNFDPSRLTSFTLIWHQTPTYSVSRLLDLLRQSSRLQFLCLRNCIPVIPEDLFAEQAVALPFLQAFEVKDTPENATRLWRLLLVSTAAKVFLDLLCASDSDSAPSDPPPFVRNSTFLRHHFRDRRTSRLWVTQDVELSEGFRELGLDLHIFSIPKPENTSSAVKSVSAAPQEVETLRLRYRLCFQAHGDLNGAEVAALRDICANLDLFNVASLTWGDALRMENHMQWLTLLDQFRELEILQVMSGTRKLYAALNFSWAGITSALKMPNGLSSLSLPVLPRLRTLVVDAARMSTTHGVHPTVADLSRMMRSRAAQGSPLSAISLKSVEIDSMTSNEEIMPYFAEIRSLFPECRFEILGRDGMPV